MSDDPKQQQLDKTKIIGFRVTEDELQNTICPVMHDCYQLGIIDRDTLTSFLHFCVQFWMGHYRMKKQQFDMSRQEIEEEKKKLDSIIAEKEAWDNWNNSTPQVMERAVKELERMGEEFDRDSKRDITQQQQQGQDQNSNKSSSRTLVNHSIQMRQS
jgi:hypothetical protein